MFFDCQSDYQKNPCRRNLSQRSERSKRIEYTVSFTLNAVPEALDPSWTVEVRGLRAL
jgi:hypothetical protein